MALISNLSVGISANMKPLQKGLKKTRNQIKGFVKSVVNIKTGIVAALGGLAIKSVLSKSLSSFKEQEQAVASLEAANKSMGRSAVGVTDAMIKHAAELQKEGIIGDEAIIQGQSFLSTFGQISDDMMPRATEAMVDLMAKSKKGGQAAANMIGKAAMGMGGALQIAGITLSDTTKAAIASEVQMKKLAKEGGINLRGLGEDGKVFKMILTDIEAQIGGTNRALGATASGGIDQFNNGIGDMYELVGSVTTNAISPWLRQLAVEMRGVSIDAKAMGDNFRKSIIDSMIEISPFVESLKGIKGVLMSLKLGFLGFGLTITGILKDAVGMWDTVFSLFGSDVLTNASGFLDESFNLQLQNVAELKTEMFALYDEIESQSFSNKFKNKLLEFDKKATQTVDDLKKPIAGKVFKPKPTNAFSVKSGDTTGGDIRPLFPKVDRTNELLGIISNNIGRQSAVFQ
jgi:hypothetical protein